MAADDQKVTQPTRSPRPASILVVDNEPLVRAVLADVLASAGYDIRQASSGPHGLLTALHDSPDVVMVDVQMPGMDGWEVLERIRADAPAVPVIMMSGLDVPERAARCGADAFLGKPYRSCDILDTVRRVLDRSRT